MRNVEVKEVKEVPADDRSLTDDYYFLPLGDPVPIKPDREQFDIRNPPLKPLVISERRGVVFVAHSSGFCVVRIKDLNAAGQEMSANDTNPSVQGSSIANVSLGNVRILALSADDSILAVSVAGNIHFFSVDSFAKTEFNPLLSRTLDESGFIKDFQWTKKKEHSYIVLLNQGRLYHGADASPPGHVMDGVDAVEWSAGGESIAVAKESNLKILSSNFSETLCIALSFEAWIGDSHANCAVKVDSIKWVRSDCIVLGCVKLIDGREDDYLIQVIRSPDGEITDGSTNPVAVSFYDLFPCIENDIVPAGVGSHLSFIYLEQRRLAIMANRKSSDFPISFLSWSLDGDVSAFSSTDIERDTLGPQIELQENLDYNFVLGLCAEKIAARITWKKGKLYFEDATPYCSLMCLTNDGKLKIFFMMGYILEDDPYHSKSG